MGNFTFRFDTILNTKEKIEDEKKNKLGISMQKLAAEQNELDKLCDKKEDLINNWNEKTKETVKVSVLRNLSHNLDLMQNIIDKQSDIVEQTEIEAEDRRKDLIEASKEKKVFEKLKEKDYEEHKYNELKKEHALTDEIVCYRATVR